jgi:hypothetical protein
MGKEEALLAADELRPRMLLNIIKYTGQSFSTPNQGLSAYDISSAKVK